MVLFRIKNGVKERCFEEGAAGVASRINIKLKHESLILAQSERWRRA